jgi:hypothetical protein
VCKDTAKIDSTKLFLPFFQRFYLFLSHMKPFHILATTLSMLLAVFPSHAQETSALRFDAPKWNFGDIGEEKGEVSHTFYFTNTASVPVVIERVLTSCGCTTPDYPRTPVAPGARAHIKVTFDPRGQAGPFEKSITVVSGGRQRDFLYITGRVVPRQKSVEEMFPYDIGGGLRLSSTLLTFRSVAPGRAPMMSVDWVNTSAQAVTLALERVEASGALEIFAPEVLCAGCRGVMTFTYDLSARTVYGQIHDVVRPVVNGVPAQTTIYATMTGVDDFSGIDTASAPRFFIDASYRELGEVRRRMVPYVFRLTASNEGAAVLHIRSVSSPGGLVSSLREGMTIAPGAELPFEVMFYSNRFPAGQVRESIRLVVNDPERPTREIRVTATVK